MDQAGPIPDELSAADSVDTVTPDIGAAPFVLGSGPAPLVAAGPFRPLPAVAVMELGRAAAGLLAALDPASAPLAVGALPFDRARPARLLQPASIAGRPAPEPARGPAPRATAWGAVPAPDASGYEAIVRRALAALSDEADPLRKVVLARSLRLTAPRPIDQAAVLAALQRDGDAAAFSVPLGGGRTLLGASPELLVARAGRRVTSRPLAGSARRSADPAVDRDRAEALLRSDKDRREHAVAAEMVRDTLAPYCRTLSAPDAPVLLSTATMWHLATPIAGELRDPSVSALELAAALHPTPAVCGVPRAAAHDLIAALEPFDRACFGGAVGWCDAGGDGSWYVAIRCGEIAGPEATLYAGCGIVAGSDPAAEAAEASAKFETMLAALGVDEHGRPAGAAA